MDVNDYREPACTHVDGYGSLVVDERCMVCEAVVPDPFGGLDVDRLRRALDLCGIGEISGHLPGTWAETLAREYAALRKVPA